MKQFEYEERLLDIDRPIAALNEAGAEGWRCVSIAPFNGGGVAVLMREKPAAMDI